jgi:hypothetical protein
LSRLRQPAMMRRELRRVSIVLLASVAALVGLILFEIGLRLFGVRYPVFDVYDHHRGIALKPGAEGWYYGEGGADLKINSWGYRDVEHTPEKPRGVFRIAVLGDSFTEARQVDIAYTFWKRVEARLRGHPPFGKRKVEVLNFGIGGYGPAQELLTLRLHTLRFFPDLVILAYCPGNDLASNSKRLSAQTNRAFAPFFILRNGELVLDNSFRDLTAEYLKRRAMLSGIHYLRTFEVLNQVRRGVALRRLQVAERKPYEIGLYDEELVEPKDSVWKEAWTVNEAIIREMNKEVLQTGGLFVLVTLSSPIQVDPDSARREQLQRALGAQDLFYTERRLRQLGRESNFPVITLAEEMQEVATSRKVYFHGFANSGRGSGHWNEQGHEFVADILVRDLPPIIREYGRW